MAKTEMEDGEHGLIQHASPTILSSKMRTDIFKDKKDYCDMECHSGDMNDNRVLLRRSLSKDFSLYLLKPI